MTVDTNDLAPDFTLPGDGGATVSLAALRGKTVVLFFYPKDSTPGCTTEALEFSALHQQFAQAGAVVIGLSKDSVKRHDAFKAKQNLTVILASDADDQVCQAYGVWKLKKNYGREYMGIERSTFLVDGSGTVRRVWRKVKVKGHAAEVLEAVKAL